ncbi:MAG: protein kinase domain-containing protein, partial [Planctomycetota bacterium]
MPAEKDTALGRLAVERGYATQAQLTEALDLQRKMHDEFGMDQSLEQILVSKHLLSQDQAQELRHAAAIQTGEARLVAGYEVISKLGQGGMGAVYKAKHRTSGQFVALKILPPSLATDELVKRFRREAEVVRKLDHENIVACTEFGFDPKRKVHFCALELVEGEDLAKRITRVGELTEDEALSITNQIAMALQHAFYNGLVHRDVKPENIMVTADGTAKLLDLGLARPANQEATRLTESGMFVGSPYYASPEQALGEREIDTRADIYSLGATLYHMVTGKPPFEGTTALAILQKHVNEKLPWPADVNPELSDGLCMIIAKMMEKSPEDRYQTPNDLNRDLDMLMEGGEPEVGEAALKNSSVKVPAVRPGRRRRPAARARHGKRLDRGRHDSARERRRAVGREERGRLSGLSALPTGAKIAAGAGVLGLVVIGLVMSLGGKEPDRRPPKRDVSEDTLRAKPGKVTLDSVPPRAGRATLAPRRASPPVSTAADAGKAQPAPTLVLDLGGGVTMEFVYIKPGVLTMGGDEDPEWSWQGVERPKHEVAITRGFYIGEYEVTQAQYEAVMGGNPSKWKEPNRPVEQVTWHQAAEFCRRATERTRRQVRLPTEAEWEYACRAGSTGRYCFGNDETGLGDYAWHGGNCGGQTHPVGQKKPNAWGLYDTHGNVWEWVADWYDAGYYAKSPREDPTGPDSGRDRLLRGGSWHSLRHLCRSAFRNYHRPSGRRSAHGFRTVVSASPPGPRAAGRPPNVPADAVEFGGHWYKLYKQKMTWHEAKAYCEKQGGHLVTITSKEENEFVTDLARKAKMDTWIGFTDEREEGTWEWVTGEKGVSTFWAKGQPDDYGGDQDRALLAAKQVFRWDDDSHTKPRRFICEWEPGWKPPSTSPDSGRAAVPKPNLKEPDSLRVGLVGHWTFDEGTGTTARDSSGKGNHGTVMGGAKWAKGKVGGALEFDGRDDFVLIPNESSFDITRSITVAVWIKIASFTKGWQAIVTKGDTHGSWRLQRDDKESSLTWACSALSHHRYGDLRGGVAVDDGRWHHVAGVYDGTRTYLYVDGKV